MLVDVNTPIVYTYNYNRKNTLITEGDVISGRLTGEVKYSSFSEDTYSKVDWQSTRKYVAAGAGIGFRDVKTYRTNVFKQSDGYVVTFNSNGVIDGEFKLGKKGSKRSKLFFDNGIIKSAVTYDSENIIVDSLFNENKIWKVNYKFVKNDGFLVFANNGRWNKAPFFREKGMKEYYENRIADKHDPVPFETKYGRTKQNGIIAIGGKRRYESEKFSSGTIVPKNALALDTGGPALGLDNNGLFTQRLQGMFDNIIYYNVDQGTSGGRYMGETGGPKEYMDFRKGSARDRNLFVLTYNYLINDKVENLKTKFTIGGTFGHKAIDRFILSLESEHYFEIGDVTALRKNSFTKYLITDKGLGWRDRGFDWRGELWNGSSYTTLKDFFERVISMTDYLKACKESIENKETEIQEIWVWNQKTNVYDKVDFEKLITLVKAQEIVAEARAEAQAKTQAEDETYLALYLKALAASQMQRFNERLEPLYSSEKNSSEAPYKKYVGKAKKRIEEQYNISIKEIVFYQFNEGLQLSDNSIQLVEQTIKHVAEANGLSLQRIRQVVEADKQRLEQARAQIMQRYGLTEHAFDKTYPQGEAKVTGDPGKSYSKYSFNNIEDLLIFKSQAEPYYSDIGALELHYEM